MSSSRSLIANCAMRPAFPGFSELSQRGIMRNLATPGSTADNALSSRQEFEPQRSSAAAAVAARPYGLPAGLQHPGSTAVSSARVPPQHPAAPRQQLWCAPFSQQGTAAALPPSGHDSQAPHRLTPPKEENPTSAPAAVMVGMSRVPSLQLMFEVI